MGDHFLVNLYECDVVKLNDEKFLVEMLEQAIIKGKMTLLNLITHKFEPQGITVVALLSESHISIHTWPEQSCCAVDVYTCGTEARPQLACEYIIGALDSKNPKTTHIVRV